jgi:hypothetical protein
MYGNHSTAGGNRRIINGGFFGLFCAGLQSLDLCQSVVPSRGLLELVAALTNLTSLCLGARLACAALLYHTATMAQPSLCMQHCMGTAHAMMCPGLRCRLPAGELLGGRAATASRPVRRAARAAQPEAPEPHALAAPGVGAPHGLPPAAK